jgi:hypothetical protein
MLFGNTFAFGARLGPTMTDEPAVGGITDSDASTFAPGIYTPTTGTTDSDASTFAPGIYTPTTGTTDSDAATFTPNLLLMNSSVATWVYVRATQTSGQPDPLGGTGADKVTEDGTVTATHIIQKGATLPNATIVCDVWVKTGASENRHFMQVSFSPGGGTLYVNTTSDAVGSGVSSGVLLLTVGSWKLWRFSQNFSGGTTVALRLAENTPTSTYSGDSSSHLYFFNPQVYAT